MMDLDERLNKAYEEILEGLDMDYYDPIEEEREQLKEMKSKFNEMYEILKKLEKDYEERKNGKQF